MKKTFSLLLAAAAMLAACSRQEQPAAVPQEFGTIEFSISPQEGPVTRAVTSYTEAQAHETRINSVQVLVFGDDGRINFHKDLGTGLTGSISTTSGTKTVYAVVNGPDLSAVATLSELESAAVDLSANGTGSSGGFVMTGKATCTVSGTDVDCAVTVSRLVSRVVLKSVVNGLPSSYGELRVERVYLSNVVGNQNLAGSAAPTTWYNREGRKDESPLVESHIIDGSTYRASCEDLTYRSVGQQVAVGGTLEPSVPYLLYSFPNAATAAPSGFSAGFTPQRSVLVVAATVKGETYYYPVVLDASTLERNTSYTVGLTVTSLGSKDPNEPVDKGSAAVTVTVDGWKAGAAYDEVI